MNGNVMRAAMLAATLAAAASLSSGVAAQACNCTHQGGTVACPANLPPGSQSVRFVPGGTMWVTPQGQEVFVPQATFPACTTTPTPPVQQPPKAPPVEPPKLPPVEPPKAPPVQTPTTPPVDTPKTPPVDTPKAPPVQPPPVQPPTPGPPIVPPTDGGRSNEDRARQLIEPPRPPIVVAPPPPDDGKATDEAIRRLGEQLRNQEKPAVPPAPQTRGDPPGPGSAPPTQTPGKTPETKTPGGDTTTSAAKECPQRGRGCVALLLNFHTYAYANGISDSEEVEELGQVANMLNALHCDTVHVEPAFKKTTSYSKKYYIGISGHGIHFSWETNPDGSEMEHNKKEMDRIAAEVAKHREKVKTKKPEIAIEMISAHGHASDLAQGDTFGWWSAYREWNRNHVPRGSFHLGSYESANHNVCQWFVYDSSCSSSLSPRALDTLNNTGTAAYTNKATDACSFHAAYETDVAVATASQASCTSYMGETVKLIEDTVVSALRAILAHRSDVAFGRPTSGPEPKFSDFIKGPMREKFASRYYDEGYKDLPNCATPDRKGYDFSSQPVPPP